MTLCIYLLRILILCILWIYIYIYIYIYISESLQICSFSSFLFYLSTCLSIYLSIYLYIYIYIIYIYIYPSIYLSIYLSIYIHIYTHTHIIKVNYAINRIHETAFSFQIRLVYTNKKTSPLTNYLLRITFSCYVLVFRFFLRFFLVFWALVLISVRVPCKNSPYNNG